MRRSHSEMSDETPPSVTLPGRAGNTMIALVPTHHSRAINRIGDALEQYHPANVTVRRIPPLRKDVRRHHLVPGETEGDVVVLFANGLRDHQQALADRCLARGQRYVVVQIALRTTRHPNTEQWRHLWSRAALVWSYYDLALWIKDDGGMALDFPHYDAPLGVDGAIFRDLGLPRTFTICTSGARRSQEGVGECDDAAFAVGGSVFQLGPECTMKSRAMFKRNVTDAELAGMYSQCQFVSGLRRHEGFELPGAEGLLCGARPIFYDQVHYRRWFDQWAEFIPEESPEAVTQNLISLFKQGPRPVTQRERSEATALFHWKRICDGFWSALNG